MPERSDPEIVAAYRRELLQDRIPRGVRTLAAAYFLIVVGYMAVDYYVYPAEYSRFLVARILTNAVFAWIVLHLGRARPQLAEHVLFLSGGAMLLYMVYEAGAAQSLYYPAFMVLFFGCGTFLPMSGSRMAALCALVTGAFAAYPLFAPESFAPRLFVTQVTFLLVSAGLAVIACRFQDALRWGDFIQRLRLARARDELEGTNRELAHALDELRDAEVQLVKRERLAAVGELSAGVAHEINNPLNFARNAVGLLRGKTRALLGAKGEEEREDLEIELAELVGMIEEGFHRSERMVQELRDMAATGTRPAGAVDLRSCLDSTTMLVRPRLRSAGVELETRIDTDLPPVRGDSAAYGQVFLNLLKNALDALEPRGGGRVEIDASREGAWVVVTVRDDGPGVPPELEDRLFEPFFSTKRAGRGTGLGLAICRRVADEHGARLALRREEGSGAIFEVHLPVDASAEASRLASAPAPAASP